MTGTTSMRPKKGALSATILVGIIIAVISIILIAFAFKGIYSTTGTTLSDSTCNMNVVIKDAFEGMPLIACSEDKVTVKADNWGTCDPDGIKGWEAGYTESGSNVYLRKCATYITYIYANSCWERYGKGKLDVTTYWGQKLPCYKVEIKGLAEDDYIFSDRVGYCASFREFKPDYADFDKSLSRSDIDLQCDWDEYGIEQAGNGVYVIYYLSKAEGYKIVIQPEKVRA